MDLSYNPLGAAALAALAGVAAKLPALVDLGLCGCNLTGVEAARTLGAAAKNWPVLHSLVLDNNPLGDDGAAVLAEAAFPRLRSLEYLHI